MTPDGCPVCQLPVPEGRGVVHPLLCRACVHQGACFKVVAALEHDRSRSTEGRLRTHREMLLLLEARRVLIAHRAGAEAGGDGPGGVLRSS
jgi:hypothetical protein